MLCSRVQWSGVTHAAAPGALWVATFVSTRLTWETEGLHVTFNVTSVADVPSGAGEPSILVLTLTPLPPRTAKGGSEWSGARVEPTLTHVHVRVPLWARTAHHRLDGAHVAMGGLSADARLSTGEQLGMAAAPTAEFWRFDVNGAALHATGASATITMRLPVALHAEPLRDPRCAYRSLFAMLYGPIVLAGLTSDTSLMGQQGVLTSSASSFHAPCPALCIRVLTRPRAPTMLHRRERGWEDPTCASGGQDTARQPRFWSRTAHVRTA